MSRAFGAGGDQASDLVLGQEGTARGRWKFLQVKPRKERSLGRSQQLSGKKSRAEFQASCRVARLRAGQAASWWVPGLMVGTWLGEGFLDVRR